MTDGSPGKLRFDLLVIGYGNELRGDDAAGPRVAAAIEARHLAGVHVLISHQLTPELADPISAAARVIFIDASAEKGVSEIRWRRLRPADAAHLMAHAVDPGVLLALASELFDRCPTAWLLTIPGRHFDLGDALSAATKAGIEKAIQRVEREAQKAPGARNPFKIVSRKQKM